MKKIYKINRMELQEKNVEYKLIIDFKKPTTLTLDSIEKTFYCDEFTLFPYKFDHYKYIIFTVNGFNFAIFN